MNTGSRTNSLSWLVALAVPVCLIVLSGCDHLLPSSDQSNAQSDASIAQTTLEPPNKGQKAPSRSAIAADIADIKQLHANYKASMQTHIITPLNDIAGKAANGRTGNFLKQQTELDVPSVRDDLLLLKGAIDRLTEKLDLIEADNKKVTKTKQTLATANASISQVNRVVIAPLLPRQIPSEEIFRADNNANSTYREETLSLSAIRDQLDSIEGNLQSMKTQVEVSASTVASPEVTSSETASSEVASSEIASSEVANSEIASTRNPSQPNATETVASAVSSLDTDNLEEALLEVEAAIAQIRAVTVDEWSDFTTVFISSARDQERIYNLSASEQEKAIEDLQIGLPDVFPRSSLGTYDAETFQAIERFVDEQNKSLETSILDLSSDGLPIDWLIGLLLLLVAFSGLVIAVLAVILAYRKKSTAAEIASANALRLDYDKLLLQTTALQNEHEKLLRSSLTASDSTAGSAKENDASELDRPVKVASKPLFISKSDIIKIYNTDCEKLTRIATAVESSGDSFVRRYSNQASPLLVEARKNGKYWVIRSQGTVKIEGDRSYLLLRKDTPLAKVNNLNAEAIEAFFMLENKQDMRNEFELIEPAIVEKIEQKGIEQWELKERGRIRFKENLEAEG
ncbi:MAG: hypothetical protein AAF716_11045 [Cyanobacteria bacterium P01_D01_bin.1]